MIDVGKTALEEHFIIREFSHYLADTNQNINRALADRAVPRLLDFGRLRLDAMDNAGVDFAVLSIAGPGVQIEPDVVLAVGRARTANDYLAHEISK